MFVGIFTGDVIPGLTFVLAKGMAFYNGGSILGDLNPFSHNVKNCQIYFTNLVLFTPQYFFKYGWSFSTLCMKKLKLTVYVKQISHGGSSRSQAFFILPSRCS